MTDARASTERLSEAQRPLSERLWQLEERILSAVPPIKPPPLYWLNSEASASYCRPHAEEARAKELGLQEVPQAPDRFAHEYAEDEYDRLREAYDEFAEGIDGGFDSSPGDSTQACETCGCTLRYTLTDYGVAEEIDHFIRHPFESITPEDSYALSRVFLDLTQPFADEHSPSLLTLAVKVAEQAVAVLPPSTILQDGGHAELSVPLGQSNTLTHQTPGPGSRPAPKPASDMPVPEAGMERLSPRSGSDPRGVPPTGHRRQEDA